MAEAIQAQKINYDYNFSQWLEIKDDDDEKKFFEELKGTSREFSCLQEKIKPNIMEFSDLKVKLKAATDRNSEEYKWAKKKIIELNEKLETKERKEVIDKYNYMYKKIEHLEKVLNEHRNSKRKSPI